MNYTLTYPCGEDYNIEAYIKRQYPYLKGRWGVNDGNYLSFGRAVRNNADGGYIPEYWNETSAGYIGSDGTSVRGGLFFEKHKVVSFFGQLDPMKKSGARDDVARFELLFFIDLSIISPGGLSNTANMRLDEICINDVKNFVQNNGCGLVVVETVRDIARVLENFKGPQKNSTLTRNMQTDFCFKLILELRYNPQIFTSPAPPRQLEPMDTLIVLFIKSSPDLTKKIPVGNGQFIYQEYAPSGGLTPMIFNTTTPYLPYKKVQMLLYNNQPDLLATYDTTTGIWDRTGQGSPFGFNDTDFVGILFTDLT